MSESKVARSGKRKQPSSCSAEARRVMEAEAAVLRRTGAPFDGETGLQEGSLGDLLPMLFERNGDHAFLEETLLALADDVEVAQTLLAQDPGAAGAVASMLSRLERRARVAVELNWRMQLAAGGAS